MKYASQTRQTLFGDTVAACGNEWETPEPIFHKLHAEFNFEIDVCAMPYNAKLEKFFTPEVNGLLQEWAPHRCYMNPPYGKQIAIWLLKAVMESRDGALVVALLPARTNAPWWERLVIGVASEVRFIRGKVKFPNPYGATGVAPWGSCVAVYLPKQINPLTICKVF